jgi:hypothetical protein
MMNDVASDGADTAETSGSNSKDANCREAIVADAQKDRNPPTAAERARLNVRF